MKHAILALALATSGCDVFWVPDPLYCRFDDDCRNAPDDRRVCDATGDRPESNHVGNTCYKPDPVDAAPEPDALASAADAAPVDAGELDAGADAAPPDCDTAPVCGGVIDLGTLTGDDGPGSRRVVHDSPGGAAWYKVTIADTPGDGHLTAEVLAYFPSGLSVYAIEGRCGECGGAADATGVPGAGYVAIDFRRDEESAERDDSTTLWLLVTESGGNACDPYTLDIRSNTVNGRTEFCD